MAHRRRPIPLGRVRCALVALVASAIVTATGGVGVAAADPCPPTPAADVTTARGWVGYLAAHPADYGLVITDGNRVTVSHDADRPYPLASAAKLINLAAYARAAATGRVTPSRTVSVNEWERWYVPIDGNAHTQALAYLKLPPMTGVPGSARPASQRVTLAQLADVMIRFSDSAAPDALREVLGDAALTALMRPYGLTGPPPLFAGLYVGFLDPTVVTQAQQQAAGRRFHDDPIYRAAVFARATSTPTLPTDAQVDRTYSQSARGINTLIRAIANGSFGPGAKRARAVLEYQGAAPDGTVVGFKGGSLAAPTDSVLTENLELRTPSGRIGTATLLVRELSRADFDATNFGNQRLLLDALTDPAVTRALQCVTGPRRR